MKFKEILLENMDAIRQTIDHLFGLPANMNTPFVIYGKEWNETSGVLHIAIFARNASPTHNFKSNKYYVEEYSGITYGNMNHIADMEKDGENQTKIYNYIRAGHDLQPGRSEQDNPYDLPTDFNPFQKMREILDQNRPKKN